MLPQSGDGLPPHVTGVYSSQNTAEQLTPVDEQNRSHWESGATRDVLVGQEFRSLDGQGEIYNY